jgi:hypothetical protein
MNRPRSLGRGRIVTALLPGCLARAMGIEPARAFRDHPSSVSQPQVVKTGRCDRHPIVLGDGATWTVRPLPVVNG